MDITCDGSWTAGRLERRERPQLWTEEICTCHDMTYIVSHHIQYECHHDRNFSIVYLTIFAPVLVVADCGGVATDDTADTAGDGAADVVVDDVT